MKKVIMVLLVSLICMSVMSGCTEKGVPQTSKNDGVSAENSSREQSAPVVVEKETGENGIVDIKEKMFITQINDVYLNPDDYMDKKIRLEGFHSIDDIGGEAVHGVIRNGPGCCGNDGVAGFQFVWDGDYPKKNDWLRVVGTIEIVKDADTEYIRLKATEVEVLEKRGAEFVEN